MKALLRVAIFLGVCLLGAGLAWLGGFDFDQRNWGVAYGTFTVLVVAGMAAFLWDW